MVYDVMFIKKTWFKREPTDPKIYSESLLYYKIKCILNDAGFDVVKKLMCKDDHLVADTQYYIRDRRGRFSLHDTEYAIRSLVDVFNSFEAVELTYSD